MEKIRVFDARITYGRPYLQKEPERSLGEEMRLADAEKAVVVMDELTWLTPQKSIELVNSRTAETPDAWGVYFMLSALTGETPSVEELLKGFRKNRIAGMYLHPAEFGVPLDPIMLKDELDACEKHHIPVFYYLDAKNPYEYLCSVLRDHPNLIVVLATDEEWPNERKLYPLLKVYPGLHLCLSELVWTGALEDMVEKFGSERLLYSSSWPKRYPGGTVLMVMNGKMTDEDRENIFHKNLERLIGGIDYD